MPLDSFIPWYWRLSVEGFLKFSLGTSMVGLVGVSGSLVDDRLVVLWSILFILSVFPMLQLNPALHNPALM